eukprot:7711322-Ditylum_brightwellii.AAC.1
MTLNDATATKSRTGYITISANFPILWASKLQTLVTLSTIQVECVALRTATREAIIFMIFLSNIDSKGISNTTAIPDILLRNLRTGKNSKDNI